MRTKIALAILLGLLSPVQAQVSKSTLNANTSTSFPDNTTGAITPASVRSYLSTLIASFQQFAGVRSVTVTTDTIGVSDYGQLIDYNNASPIAVTLPAANGSFSTFNTYVSNAGAGAVTITPQGGSTINGVSTLVLQTGQGAWIVSDGTNYQIQSNGLNASQFTAGTNIAITGGISPTIAVTAPISATSYTAHGILIGEGTANLSPTVAMSNGQLLVGQTGADPLPKTPSQDCTLAASGAFTCLKTNNISFTSYATAAVGQLPGTTTNDSATAGNIGELITSNVLVGSAVGLSTGSPINLTSMSLTAGDWEVTCEMVFNGGASTTVTYIWGAIGTSTGTVNQLADTSAQMSMAGLTTPYSTVSPHLTVGPTRVSLSGTTTYFCVAQSAFATSTSAVFGMFRARRVR